MKMDSRSLFFLLFTTIVTLMIFYVLVQYSSLTSSSDITFDVKSNDDIVFVKAPDRVSFQTVGSPSTPGECITTIEKGYPYNELNYVFYGNDDETSQINTTFYCRVKNKSDRFVKISNNEKSFSELPPNHEFEMEINVDNS